MSSANNLYIRSEVLCLFRAKYPGLSLVFVNICSSSSEMQKHGSDDMVRPTMDFGNVREAAESFFDFETAHFLPYSML